jgi:hypothetical protein
MPAALQQPEQLSGEHESPSQAEKSVDRKMAVATTRRGRMRALGVLGHSPHSKIVNTASIR